MTGTEIIKKALEQGRKNPGKATDIYLDAQDKLNARSGLNSDHPRAMPITDMTNADHSQPQRQH